jgi:hypothetical protein
MVNSGIPPLNPLFNGTICRHGGFDYTGFTSRSFGRENVCRPNEAPIRSSRFYITSKERCLDEGGRLNSLL